MADLTKLDTLEVFGAWKETILELKRRGLVRSVNMHPLGGYAEYLVARHYGADLNTGRDSGYDLVRPDNEARVQVKGRHFEANQFGDFSKFRHRRFDEFVGVVFNEDFTVGSAWHMPWETVERLGRPVQEKHRLRLARVRRAIREGDETITELDLSGDT